MSDAIKAIAVSEILGDADDPARPAITPADLLDLVIDGKDGFCHAALLSASDRAPGDVSPALAEAGPEARSP